MTFFEKYEALCKSQNIKPSGKEAEQRIGISKGVSSAWKDNGNLPSGKHTVAVAKFFDVSADYLLGIIEEPHPLNVDSKLTPNEGQVLLMLRELNAEGQEAAIAMLSGLMAQDIYKKYPADAMDQKKQA